MKSVVLLILAVLQYVNAGRDKNLYCGACKAIVDEIDHSISLIDPNKKIDVGSYRVDPKGKTRTVQKSYARSESHLTELLESVCKEVSDNYVETKDPVSGGKTLKRMVTHDGKMSTDVDFQKLMQDTQSQGDTPPDAKSNKVKFACESIVEDFEDEFLHHFKNSHTDGHAKICADIAEYCEEDSKDEL